MNSCCWCVKLTPFDKCENNVLLVGHTLQDAQYVLSKVHCVQIVVLVLKSVHLVVNLK